MKGSPLVFAVQERLQGAGYSQISTPMKVAGVGFDFTGAMRGSDGRSLDLVLLVDTATGEFGDREGSRVQQRVEALSRALDVTGSRFVLTVILAGATLESGVDALTETCRVLQVEGIDLNDAGQPSSDVAARRLDDRIRVLLPLTLPAAIPDWQNQRGPAIEQLIRTLPAGMDQALVDAVITASAVSEEAVGDAIASVIDHAFEAGTGDESS